MTRLISLAHLTVIDLAPPQMIRMAAEAGYDRVGLRLVAVNDTTPGYPLMDDPAGMRDTRAALAETGLSVLDIEFVKITPEFDPGAWEAFLDAGAALGARHVICAPYDPDLSRLSDRLAAFADLCRPRALGPVLEFFPWTVVPDLATAARVVAQTARADVGILVDALHFDRSGSRLSDLAALPASRLPFVHLCDAPVHPPYTTEALMHAGRAERLPPGQGQIDLRAFLDRIPPDCPVALEVPMAARQAVEGSAAVARAAIGAARALLSWIGRGPAPD